MATQAVNVVARILHPRQHLDGRIRITFGELVARQDPHHEAAGLGTAMSGRFHHAAEAAIDHDMAAPGDFRTDLISESVPGFIDRAGPENPDLVRSFTEVYRPHAFPTAPRQLPNYPGTLQKVKGFDY